MIRKQQGNLFWYEFELLQPFPYLRHGCFASLKSQLGFQASLPLIKEVIFKTDPGSLIDVNQVHGIDTAIISSSSSPLGAYDALATSLPNIGLLIKHADCQSCLLFDPEHRVIGNVHCGWRGNVNNIYKSVIAQLHREWGTRAEALIACISPSLGPCHSEFTNWETELPLSFASYRKEGVYFDLWETSFDQLTKCGVPPSHIEIARICTYCHPELFFSYRRDKTSQRNATCIALM
jgi:YfiH family protein